MLTILATHGRDRNRFLKAIHIFVQLSVCFSLSRLVVHFFLGGANFVVSGTPVLCDWQKKMSGLKKNPAALREVLAQWEKSSTCAPLTQAQHDSVIDLASHADDRALPDLV